ncbi:hypothetical protein P153DRAFT_434071 [Dothidotthia symphoricarpi CBS 119687]|uniref:BZIP domain-containing protein n=1 Tax=Dothidotthia symphoricarpi CBS 119687 TaxID=1392245 RepID=A0A6A6A559_9PLEO|nr:uncharacterized protein P153DRAFT_434071 [Dothidotthia symphoricarpi CBS 119687]KAF2126305.1 hypothetical protein P153DRAFT_434071 [Dothidotthia symphoricarpi CBS 119687]
MDALSEVVQPKEKRLMTEARRQQSRAAQKRYREKQKRRLAELSSFASASHANEPSHPIPMSSGLLKATWLPSSNGGLNLVEEQSPVNAQGRAGRSVESNEVESLSAIEGITVNPNWNMNIPFGGPNTFQLDDTCLSSENMLEGRMGRDCQTIAASEYPTLSEQVADTQDIPEAMQFSRVARPYASIESSFLFPVDALPAPSIPRDTYIRVHRYSLLNSFMENATMLGYTLDWVTTYGCHLKSLWCPTLPQPQSQMGIRVHWREDIPAIMKVAPDLAPTATQLQYPHLLYIDIFPFPEFREKMLALRAVRPKVFEEEDFRRDIDTGEAICCWGPTPWEKRSWEAQPWFLRKWWMLTGGEEGEMGSLSRWWRRFRGEEI